MKTRAQEEGKNRDKKKYCVLKIPEDKLYTWMAREI